NQFLKYAKGTKVKFGRGLSNRLFADYSVRVDEYQNQVDLHHEVELSYQLKRNLYLRGISELDNDHQLGRLPDRRAILENQWRFGRENRKKDNGAERVDRRSENKSNTIQKRLLFQKNPADNSRLSRDHLL